MRPQIIDAEYTPKGNLPADQYFQQMDPNYQPPQQLDPQQLPMEDYFHKQNDLRVIQEYNRDELVPASVKNEFWGMVSKSIKLGFWDKEDEKDLFFYKNIIRIGSIMSKPKHKYTFKDRQTMNMLDLLTHADFKRGVGMEKYKINERTLQATSVTQSIQGTASGKKAGMLAGLKAFFT